MSEKEYKTKCENLFQRNTILINELETANNRIKELEAQIEKMKSDVKANVKWADENENNQMYCKLNAMVNQWEIKEK